MTCWPSYLIDGLARCPRHETYLYMTGRQIRFCSVLQWVIGLRRLAWHYEVTKVATEYKKFVIVRESSRLNKMIINLQLLVFLTQYHSRVPI